jgi:FKBP-type peptidyl-prolyl cis-trans isomerase SlpA
LANKTPIGPGAKVKLTFSLSLEGGELIDSTGDRPAEFVVGDGSLLPGFEHVMFGLVAGESGEFKVPTEHAFGPVNPDNIQMMKRSNFAADIDPSVGLLVSFADQQNAELPGVVKRILGDLVEVDFNHPLAGREVLFQVAIIAVEQVTNEILRV